MATKFAHEFGAESRLKTYFGKFFSHTFKNGWENPKIAYATFVRHGGVLKRFEGLQLRFKYIKYRNDFCILLTNLVTFGPVTPDITM